MEVKVTEATSGVHECSEYAHLWLIERQSCLDRVWSAVVNTSLITFTSVDYMSDNRCEN